MRNSKAKTLYKVHTPMMALKHLNDSHCRIVKISRDCVISVIGTPQEFNLVDIDCQGERLAVFSPSIGQRTSELREG